MEITKILNIKKIFALLTVLLMLACVGTSAVQAAVSDYTPPSNDEIIYYNSAPHKIFWLQESLKALGFNPGSIDGVLGPQTESAIISFQKINNLTADGIAGPLTITALKNKLSTSATLTSANIKNGDYVILSKLSGLKVITIAGGKVNGAPAVLSTYNGDSNQVYTFKRLADNSYMITAKHSGLSLEVRNSSHSDRTEVAQWEFLDNYGCKRWYIIDCGNGYYKFVNKESGKVLDVDGGKTANNTRIQQFTDNSTDSQRFTLLSASNGNNNTSSASSASAGLKYTNKQKMMEYAYNNALVNDGTLCAEFVVNCLQAGGIQIPDKYYTDNQGDTGSARKWAPSLLQYLKESGNKIIYNPKKSQIDVGDILMYDGMSGPVNDNPDHVVIVRAKDDFGNLLLCAHNNNRRDVSFEFFGQPWLVIKIS